MTTIVLNTKIGEVENKIPDTSALALTAVLKTKIGDIEKIPDASGLVTAFVLNTKIEVENEIPDHAKYITTPECNNFAGLIFDMKLKQANLTRKSDAYAVSQHTDKNKEEIEKPQTFDLTYFLGKTFFGDNGFQNMFVYQPTLNTFELKKDKRTEHFIGWKSKGLFKSKLFHYTVLSFTLHNFKGDNNCQIYQLS